MGAHRRELVDGPQGQRKDRGIVLRGAAGLRDVDNGRGRAQRIRRPAPLDACGVLARKVAGLLVVGRAVRTQDQEAFEPRYCCC